LPPWGKKKWGKNCSGTYTENSENSENSQRPQRKPAAINNPDVIGSTFEKKGCKVLKN